MLVKYCPIEETSIFNELCHGHAIYDALNS